MGTDALWFENAGLPAGQYGKGQASWRRRGKHFAVAIMGTLILASSAFAQGAGKKPNWQTVEADNGAIYKVDLNSISHYHNGTADVIVYAVQGSGYNPENMRRLWFDCHGRFRDETGPHFGTTEYAPPRSMAGRISEIACAAASDASLNDPSGSESAGMPASYCAGFSSAACVRIKEAAQAREKPVYCTPGFEHAQDRLSIEQIRICYVIANQQSRRKRSASPRSATEGSEKPTYDITLTASANKFPNIIGSTNLPDGAKLLVSINRPRLPNARELLAAGLPMCQDDCIPASGPKGEVLGVSSVVLAGAFSAGPFSWAGKPFGQGTFEVDVFLLSLPSEDITSLASADRLSERMRRPILTAPVTVSPQQ